jgi:hypothetical protein
VICSYKYMGADIYARQRPTRSIHSSKYPISAYLKIISVEDTKSVDFVNICSPPEPNRTRGPRAMRLLGVELGHRLHKTHQLCEMITVFQVIAVKLAF